MSGGSFEYLYQRDGEVEALVPEIEAMAAALTPFPQMQRETQAIADLLKSAAAGVRRLSTLWHNVEWNVSGDWSRAPIRSEAIKLGEVLSLCEHRDLSSYWAPGRDGKPDETGKRCEDCGERFDAKARADG